LTPANHESLLAAAAGKSKRDVEVLLAKAFPSPVVPSSVRKIPVRRPTPLPTCLPASLSASLPAVESDAGPMNVPQQAVSRLRPLGTPTVTPPGGDDAAAAPESASVLLTQPAAPSKRLGVVRPLAEDRYEVRITVSAATREKLRRATDLLRHAIPDGDAAQIIERALTTLLDDLARKKLAATTRPRPVKGGAASTRHVPAHVKRTVWLRDGGRCAFVSGSGRRCPEEGHLEFHHVRPYGVGGETTLKNIQLRCRAHNDYEAERFYGRRFSPAAMREGAAELGPDRVAGASMSEASASSSPRISGD
jgi:hypothetical protein